MKESMKPPINVASRFKKYFFADNRYLHLEKTKIRSENMTFEIESNQREGGRTIYRYFVEAKAAPNRKTFEFVINGMDNKFEEENKFNDYTEAIDHLMNRMTAEIENIDRKYRR